LLLYFWYYLIFIHTFVPSKTIKRMIKLALAQYKGNITPTTQWGYTGGGNGGQNGATAFMEII
jgi:hypothetical protein